MLTISAVWIPVLITLVLMAIMFRPCGGGDFSFEPLFRLFWIVPIMGVWLIYMAIRLWVKG